MNDSTAVRAGQRGGGDQELPRARDLDGLAGYPTLTAVLSAAVPQGAHPLLGWRVLAVQHVQSSTVPLVAALCAAGVDPRDVTMVGKAYSTRPDAVAALVAAGVKLPGREDMPDPCRSYEEQIAEEVAEQVAVRAGKGVGAPLLVVDEGAIAARALTRACAATPGRWAVVEQTTRGARWWSERLTVPVPVVDVARSAAKRELEAPLIAESMLAGLRRALSECDLAAGSAVFGVVGFGAIGARLARALRAEGLRVRVHDSHQGARRAGQQEGFDVLEPSRLYGEVDVLVGCTGTRLLDDADLAALRRPLVLVNGASSDIEFALWRHRVPSAVRDTGTAGDSGPGRPWRHHYTIGSTVSHVLAAGGFPINFHSDDEPIAAESFQLTRALMLAGALQAAGERTAGLHRLDPGLQSLVARAHDGDRLDLS